MQGNGWKGEHCLTVFPSLHSSGSLDDTHGIPQLLRTRSQNTTGAELPQLGALLGRGSYGKVYKGKDPSLCVTLLAPGSHPFHRSNPDASVNPHLMQHGHCGGPAVRLLGWAGFWAWQRPHSSSTSHFRILSSSMH